MLISMTKRHHFDCFIGTQTASSASDGIYLLRFHPETKKFEILHSTIFRKNPTFLVPSTETARLFSVQELAGDRTGKVTMFTMRDSGNGDALKTAGSASSGGHGPCHLLYDEKRRRIVVANYTSGSVGVIAVSEKGKTLETVQSIQHHGSSVDKQRQRGPHVHSVTADPANQRVLVCDLGLDEILVYAWNEDTLLLSEAPVARAKVAPGSGPRHFAFHPSGTFGYVANEMGNTVTVFRYDAAGGTLTEIQTTGTLPSGFAKENTTADIHVDAAGKRLYVSNRGHDSIAVYCIDGKSGTIDLAGFIPTAGKTPRNFALAPDGQHLFAANQKSDTIAVFDLSGETLPEKPTAQTDIPAPVCIRFMTMRLQTGIDHCTELP